MWAEFRELDRQRQELSIRLDKLDKKVFRLTRKYKRLLQDEEETEEWVAEVEILGTDSTGKSQRENNARQALEAIRREIRQLSVKASALDEKRWR